MTPTMHEKIHVNPKFLNSTQSASQNVHFNPHFIGQSTQKEEQISSTSQPKDQWAINVNEISYATEIANNPTTINPLPQVSFVPTFPPNYPPPPPVSLYETPNVCIQEISNSVEKFNPQNTVNSSSYSRPRCSTSIYDSTSVSHKQLHGTSIYPSSGAGSSVSHQLSSLVYPSVSTDQVLSRADNTGAGTKPYDHLVVKGRNDFSGWCPPQKADHNVKARSNDTTIKNSDASLYLMSKGSNVKKLSPKLSSNCFINPKFIKKSEQSSVSSEYSQGSVNNIKVQSIHNAGINASRQSNLGTALKEQLVNSSSSNLSSKSFKKPNLCEALSQGVVEKGKFVLKINSGSDNIVTTQNYCNESSKMDRSKASHFDPNSVFINPQFLKPADLNMKKNISANTRCVIKSQQSIVVRNVDESNSSSVDSGSTFVTMNSAPSIVSPLLNRSGADFANETNLDHSTEMTKQNKKSQIASVSLTNMQEKTWPSSNLPGLVTKADYSSPATWKSSGSSAIYVNKNKLIRSTKYATRKQCSIKSSGPTDKHNKVMNSELRPIMISTKNKLVRKRTTSSSSTNSKQLITGSSKLNLSLKNKYCSAISPKIRAQKYSFISKNKLVKCASNNLIRKKISPKKFLWSHKFSKTLPYSKPNLQVHGTGSRKIASHIVSKYSTRGSNGTKQSDRFVRIGESMYKSTATSLMRQLPVRASTSKGTPLMIRNPLPSGRRWHTGTSWSRCWVTDRKAHNTAMVFPSLHSFRISNSNYAHQNSKSLNFNARKKLYYTSYSCQHQTAQDQRGLRSGLTITNKPKLSSNKRLALVAHAEKAQMLQRLIIAAKQRSVYILQRKAARRNIALPLPLETVPSKEDHKQNQSTQIVLRRGNISNISVAREASSSGSTKVPYCRFYHRFGRCFRGTACPYEHNPDRVAICTRFLRGRCHVPKCLFAHTLDKGRMPVCSHFLRDALCTRPQCPYLHVNPNPKAPICEDFLHGHCDQREKCKLQHVLECAEFRETGRCPRSGRCPLPHPTRRPPASALRQNSSNSKKGRNKNKRQRTVSNGSGQGILGAPATVKRKKETKPKKQVLARYFRSEETTPDECCVTKTSSVEGRASAAVGSSIAGEQCQLQLKEKKQRIMSLIEKMKSRAGNCDSFTGTPTSSAAVGKVKTPVLNTGKYKIVDDEDVILVQPILEYSADLSLPSFIPLSETFSLVQPSLASVRSPHLQVLPSHPLGSLELLAVNKESGIQSFSNPSSPGRRDEHIKVRISLQPSASQTTTLPQSSSQSFSRANVSPRGSSAKLLSPASTLPIDTIAIKPRTNTDDSSARISFSPLCGHIEESFPQELISGAVAPRKGTLVCSSKISPSEYSSKSVSCSDSTKISTSASLSESSMNPPTSTSSLGQLDASMES